ncbi:MAG: hypothetical protein ABIS45_13085 [Burkholderiales bacterium]
MPSSPLHAEIAKALQQLEVRQRFLNLGGDVFPAVPTELAKTCAAEPKSGAR